MRISLQKIMTSKKIRIGLLILWLSSLGLALVLTLQPYPFFWKTVSIASQSIQIGNQGEYLYVTTLGTDGEASSAKLFEDEKALGPEDALKFEIGAVGGGRYSYKEGKLFFSTSDNSDPHMNGRRYTLALPLSFKRLWLLLVWACVLLLSLFILVHLNWRYRSKIMVWVVSTFNSKNIFIFSIVIVVIAFLIPRLPWFVDFPIPLISPDSAGYAQIAAQLISNKLPDFSMRLPGYPIFLALCLLPSPRMWNVVFFQNVLSLASALFFLWVVYKHYGRLVFGAALAMVAKVTNTLLVGLDVSILTESLYTSSLVFCIGLLILAICTHKPRFFFLFSLTCGFTVWIRPSGLFLIGVLILVLLFILVNRYSVSSYFSLVLPILILILLPMLYNYINFHSFSLTTMASRMPYAITSSYWEPDASLSDGVNDGIRRFKNEISESDKKLFSSWDYSDIMIINGPYANYANKAYYRFRIDLNRDQIPETEIKQIANIAIMKHPEMRIKLFLSSLITYLNDPSSWLVSPYVYIVKSNMDLLYKEGYNKLDYLVREYRKIPDLQSIHIVTYEDNIQFIIDETLLYDIYKKVNIDLSRIFDSKLWLLGYAIVLGISSYITVRTTLRHQGAFLLLAISSFILFSAIAFSYVAPVDSRYPAPTRFIEVFSLAFIPLFWARS